MTSPGLGVNTDRLAKCEPAFVSLSRRVEQIRAGLDAKLRSAGECWGGPDDKLGKAFADKYVDPSKQISDGLTNMVEVLSSVADGIRTMSKGAVHTEEQATEQAAGALRTGRTLESEGTVSARGYSVSKMADATTEPQTAARTMTSARLSETVQATPMMAARMESVPAQMSPTMVGRTESIPAQPLQATEGTPLMAARTETMPLMATRTEAMPLMAARTEAMPLMATRTEAMPAQMSPMMVGRTESVQAQPVLHTVEATPVMATRGETQPLQPLQQAEVSPMVAARVEAAPVLQPMQGRLVSEAAEPVMQGRLVSEAAEPVMQGRLVSEAAEPLTPVRADVRPAEDQAVTLRRILDGQG